MPQEYAPEIHNGLPIAKKSTTKKAPFDLYSNKKIVSSSNGLREQAREIEVMADELAQKVAHFENQSTNDIVYNSLKLRGQS